MTRLLAIGCLTFATLVHALSVNLGLRLQNILGACGITSLLVIAFSGLLALSGVVSPTQNQPLPRNFAAPWKGTNTDANAVVSGLFAVIW